MFENRLELTNFKERLHSSVGFVHPLSQAIWRHRETTLAAVSAISFGAGSVLLSLSTLGSWEPKVPELFEASMSSFKLGLALGAGYSVAAGLRNLGNHLGHNHNR